MPSKAGVVVVFVAVSVLTTGCSTLFNISGDEPPNKIYVGTRSTLRNPHGALLDLPFSFVLDTILLPYTIPVTIYNSIKNKPPEK